MKKLDKLNMNVTSAVFKAEEAQIELAHAELAIAKATSPNSMEGEIARHGAIRAAKAAGLHDWAGSMLKTFLAEKGLGKKLRAELRKLASSDE